MVGSILSFLFGEVALDCAFSLYCLCHFIEQFYIWINQIFIRDQKQYFALTDKVADSEKNFMILPKYCLMEILPKCNLSSGAPKIIFK